MWWSVCLLPVFAHLTISKGYEYSTDVLKVLTQVAERVKREETGVHDVLCIDCHASWSEELLVSFHKLHPFFPIKILNSSVVRPHEVDWTPASYRASLILVSCIYDGQCLLEQLLDSPSINKYAVYFLMFINPPKNALDQAITFAKECGIIRVVQVVGDTNAGKTGARCGGAFLLRAFQLPLAHITEVLFNQSLTRPVQFNYVVAIAPLSINTFVINGTMSGFEVDIFRIIVEHQQATFQVRKITKTNQLTHVLKALHEGQMDVILNNLISNVQLKTERAVWQEHLAYCIMLPKTVERAHLQLLLHPFKWHIWLIIIGMLVSMQLLNVIFPGKFTFNFIMMCFFGSGPAEHSLASAERLLLCSACVIIFLLSETYQAILLSLITANPYLKNPETVDEFLERNISLYVLSGLMHLIPSKLFPVAKSVSSTSLYVTLTRATVERCSNVFFWNANPLKLLYPVLKDELITVKPPVFYSPSFVTFSQLSPATRAYQTYMDRLFEAGIYRFIYRKYYPDKMFSMKEETFNDSIVLTEDLVPVWELFAFGLVASTLVFLGEWIYFYLKLLYHSRKNVA